MKKYVVGDERLTEMGQDHIQMWALLLATLNLPFLLSELVREIGPGDGRWLEPAHNRVRWRTGVLNVFNHVFCCPGYMIRLLQFLSLSTRYKSDQMVFRGMGCRVTL